MMGKNKSSNSGADARAKVGTLIGKGAVFDGNLTAPETIRIDGTINGNCECKALLILGPDGYIKGDINAQNVMISGRIDGDIYVQAKLELLSTGKVAGNITARSLVIDEGAVFDGRCTMNESASTNSVTGTSDNKSGDNKSDNDKKNNNDNKTDSSDDKNKKKY